MHRHPKPLTLAADALYGRVHNGAVEETLQPDALKKYKL
jgi:hypothetical protein